MSKISINSILGIITNKYLMLGLVFYGVSTILWFNVLSKMKLSVAYPMISMGYVFTTILAFFFLKEEIGLNQIGGLCLIIAGIVWISR